MTDSEIQPPKYAQAVLHFDEQGRVVGAAGELESLENSGPMLCMLGAAVEQFGAQREMGGLDTLMMSFERKTILVAKTTRGYVALIADRAVQMGLLFHDIRAMKGGG